jgi:hypothetical protein
MKDDERMDLRIQELARGLNAPPPTPRAEMWERIQAERASRRQAVIPLRRRVRWVGWAVGLAATLALGVALGRMSMRSEPAAPVAAVPEAATGVEESMPAAYRVATTEHLGQVETFLTVFSAEAPGGRRLTNADFEMPARQLLRRTRMLRESPAAANDMALRALLDDVELVLLQITAFAQVGDERELDFVEQGITDRSVMLRLRSALPSVPQRGTVGGSL